MLPIRVFIVSPSSPQTESSIRLALTGIDSEIVIADENEVLAKIVEDKFDIVHIVNDGFLVLPEFYKALLLLIEDTGFDYVCSSYESIGQESQIVGPMDAINPSQFIIRQWVAKELGPPATIKEIFNRIVVEYKGEEFKGVLGIELN